MSDIGALVLVKYEYTGRSGWKVRPGLITGEYLNDYQYAGRVYDEKVTDMQAAIGCAQLEKLPAFIEARKKNFRLLYEGLKDLEERFILPEATPNSDPSWFGFLLTVRKDAGFTRDQIVKHLKVSKRIQGIKNKIDKRTCGYKKKSSVL